MVSAGVFRTTLEIPLAWPSSEPLPGELALGQHRGGAETLLRWLETQLGLGREPVPRFLRVAALAPMLESIPDACWTASLEKDRWATAAELLQRRDELMLAGWDGRGGDGLPPLVRDLGRLHDGFDSILPGEADRLEAVLAALDLGQRLPPHLCLLHEPFAQWPASWGRVLARLTTAEAPGPEAGAPAASTLAAIQRRVAIDSQSPLACDPSLRWVEARSRVAACEFVAASLAVSPGTAEHTVVCCEDLALAAQLDASLQRAGLPAMGAAVDVSAHPAFQVLPIVLGLLWLPVDPRLVLDLLMHPLSPLPRAARRPLTEALIQQPGLGSGAWQSAIEALAGSSDEGEQKAGQAIAAWLGGDRYERGQAVPGEAIAERCTLVAEWAARRSGGHRGDDEDLSGALGGAAEQARWLRELVLQESRGIPAAQLDRLLEVVRTHGARARIRPQLDGSPRLASGLHEVAGPCDQLVWLGLDTEYRPRRAWTRAEISQLQAAGIEVDDGTKALNTRAAAERCGLAQVRHRLLALAVPGGDEGRPHGAWVRIRTALGKKAKPANLERMISAGDLAPIAPWQAPIVGRQTTAVPPRRPLWSAPPGLIRDRDTSSATELQKRLACPLRWVLEYSAKLRSGAVTALPEGIGLVGTFCHAVLETVLGSGGGLPPPDRAADEVRRVFDERIALDAAPLAQPHRQSERLQVRDQLAQAVQVLLAALHRGGYTGVRMEEPVEGTVDGRQLNGSIDCLATRDEGQEAVIDFKIAGRNKYPELLGEGRATQLATYAYSRSEGGRRGFPAVGYLVLKDALLSSPTGSPIAGCPPADLVDGPAVGEVWQQFLTALRSASGWLTGDEPIPARPLQAEDERPEGAALVIDQPASSETVLAKDPCRWCDYQILCGARELT